METKGKRGENMIKAYAKSDIGKVREINQKLLKKFTKYGIK